MSHVYYESRELCCLVILLQGINDPVRSFFFEQTGNRSPVVPTAESWSRCRRYSPGLTVRDTDPGFWRAKRSRD